MLFHYCITGVYKSFQSIESKLRPNEKHVVNSWLTTNWSFRNGHIRLDYSSCLEAEHLIKSMIERDCDNRPSSSAILRESA